MATMNNRENQQTRMSRPNNRRHLFVAGALIYAALVISGAFEYSNTQNTVEAFSLPSKSSTTAKSTSTSKLSSQASDADLLQDLPFVATEAMTKFMAAVGDPLATKTIVSLVAKLQEKSVNQANAMKWINENALTMIPKNATIVGLLANKEIQQVQYRAKFETDRGVWSASMDVFVPTNDEQIESNKLSQAGTALQALKEGMGDEGISSFDVNVLEDSVEFRSSTVTTTDNTKKVGLVNAYFVPDDEIKILVVEIDDILHNVTWKGLDS